ncbi:hypothetical protein M407DRAFT_246501 [Tulasnella calospora MUT 4182]|uniref:Uncharacterized protein n=1 Tax=Tulasnella calospora MUT 4182 TaxID=1051891 RepID=A0A0C3Q5L2_9AGAM|nr:hypothetical protein M407DRAFT_246501 [Tulasnella calospora MUT 4182]
MTTKRTPTRYDAGSPSESQLSTRPLRTNPPLLGDLSNRPPAGTIDRWIWQKRMWVESTSAMTMLEPWEKLLVCVVFTLIMTTFAFGIFHYLPHHLHVIYGRAKYYLLGDESAPLVMLWSQALGEL